MLAMVMRARLLETASLSGNGFLVLITGSVLETGQSIQTSCCDDCSVLIIRLVFYFLFVSWVFWFLVGCLAFGILAP